MSFRSAVTAILCLALTPAGVVAQDKYVEADGIRLRYVDHGAGDPVVLVHGFTNTAQIWATNGILQSLARDHRVIAFDLRGHGKSSKPHDPSRYGAEMSRDIVRVLDGLGIQRAHIIGYSLGGMITSQLLTLRPERFLSATLIAGPGRFEWNEELAREAEGDAAEMERDCISRSMMFRLAPPDKPHPSEDSLKVLSSTCLADTTQDRFALAAVTRSRRAHVITPAAAARVVVPTLGIVGTADPMREGMEALVRLRPSVRLVVVDGATHAGPTGVLRRPETIAAIRAFLAEHHGK